MGTKGYKGAGMDGFIARQYDKTARRHMGDLYRTWAEKLARELPEGALALEVAPGPGYLAIELARRRKVAISGLDISRTLVAIARRNAHEAGVEIDFRHGNVSSMPFANEQFDFVMCTSSFKNFSQPLEALQEMYRVLKRGGKAWISDLRRDASDETIGRFVKESMNMRGLAGAFTRSTFRHTLRPRALTGRQFEELASKTSFTAVEVTENPMDWEAWCRK